MNPQKLAQNLSQFCRAQRSMRNMNIKQFSEFCGISNNALRRYEMCESFPTLYSACLMANACGVSLDVMCDWEVGD